MKPPQRDRFRIFRAVSASAVLFLLIFSGFIQLSAVRQAESAPTAAQQSLSGQVVALPKASTALYAAEPEALTTVQCGQCHISIFRDLKIDGGRHRFSCQECHKKLHEYNPVKGNWQELMPRCGNCHATPHGEKLVACTNCHDNPHAIAKVPLSKAMLDSCTICHREAGEQLQKFPSAHSKLSCNACHTSHGYKPDCSACHKPHLKDQDFKTCTPCHPVHMPREIVFKQDGDVRTCSACHSTIYEKWSKTRSKHGQVNCASCHKKHRSVPSCESCHAKPHNEQLLQKYPKCLTCHQDAHDLPVK
ncbi:cytochrome C [Geobacter sp. SVR]|uniref:cytochrome C n=1 Tax=Geobacter sp. SVR TaxID=2495594 RepID=UPI00143EFDAE|nr:cytochrome C [Geobacter sp. SVR]BCS52088.1 cytochrome c [Geobacter sp. SVR]GCF86543.1 cytochrome c [Geobacter sp. SVR]